MDEWIYLDNNATTILDEEVLRAMQEELIAPPSNPSSIHHFGQMAKARLANARHTIASFLNVKAQEIIFTSSGTEAMNLPIQGVINSQNPLHIISSNIEHSCVYHSLKSFEKKNIDITYLSPNSLGLIDPKSVEMAIREETGLIVLSAANSETGVKTDIASIAKIAKNNNIPFIVDGIALLGKESIPNLDGISAMGFSPHKFHGPKGVGFVYIHSSLNFDPMYFGGNQEYGKRAGTENLAGIIGAAKAVDLLKTVQRQAYSHMKNCRDRFEKYVLTHLDGVHINGEGDRICNTSNLSFENIDAENLLIHLDLAKICASHGSACSSGSVEPSRVLLNMKYPISRVKSSLRFSFSRKNTDEEIDHALKTLIHLVKQLRNI